MRATQMRKLLTLNKEGKLSLRAADSTETEVQTKRRNPLLLIDTSASMAGAKIEHAKFRDLATVVIVTGGQSNDNGAAVQAAAQLKNRGIDIILIGTDDADGDFLKQLATRSDLAMRVLSTNLRSAITDASRLLPQN